MWTMQQVANSRAIAEFWGGCERYNETTILTLYRSIFIHAAAEVDGRLDAQVLGLTLTFALRNC